MGGNIPSCETVAIKSSSTVLWRFPYAFKWRLAWFSAFSLCLFPPLPPSLSLFLWLLQAYIWYIFVMVEAQIDHRASVETLQHFVLCYVWHNKALTWIIALWNRSLLAGLRVWAETLLAPTDSPNIVILSGSPPNEAMLSLTHWIAALWSQSPKFPLPRK